MTNELKWPEVETWLNSNPRTTRVEKYPNSYNTDCPVRKHPSRLRVWYGDDGHIGLKCFGGCAPRDVHTAITAAIKIGASPVTEPPSVTEPRIEVLEREWNSPEAQLDLDQLIDEQFADEQTAEYWEDQATDAKAELEREHDARIAAETDRDQARDEKSSLEEQLTSECDEERKKRVAAENTAQRLQTSVDKLSKYKDKVQDKQDELDNLRKDYKSVNGKLSRRDKRILEIGAERDRLENERDQAYDDYEKLQEELPVSKSEVIKDAWELLDQNPSAALPKAWTVLEQELKRSLKIIGVYIQPKANSFLILRNAYDNECINSEQYVHLLDSLLSTRNRIIHPDDYATETLQLTKPQARAALAYLEPIIDQLHQRSQQLGS